MRMFQPLMACSSALLLLLASGTADAARRPVPTAPASSEAKTGVGKGDTEVGFFADYSKMDGGGASTFVLGAVFGKFLRDSLELRVTPVLIYSDTGGGGSFYGFDPYVTVEKLFRNSSPVVPYVGGGIGLTLNYLTSPGLDTTDIGLFVTPVAGLKFFVTERMSLEYALSYQVGFIEEFFTAGGFSDTASGTTNTLSNTLRFNIYY